MKRKLIIAGIVILCVGLFLVCIGFFCSKINHNNVAKIELETYDHKDHGQVELTEEEAREIIRLYNRSRLAGEVNAEPCCPAYGFKIYFNGGSTLYVSQGVKSKLIVRPKFLGCYYIHNQSLIQYIYELAEKYDLPID